MITLACPKYPVSNSTEEFFSSDNFSLPIYRIGNSARKNWSKEILRLIDSELGAEELIKSAGNIGENYLVPEIKNVLRHSSIVLMKGLPLCSEDFGRKKIRNKQSLIEGFSHDDLIVLSAVKALRLEPFSYEEQKNGVLVQDIFPVKGFEDSNSNAGTGDFGFHTDDAILHRDFRTLFIALLCINNQAQATTYYAPLDSIRRFIDPYYFNILQQPRFRVLTPESFSYFGGKRIQSEPRSIITKYQHRYEIALATYNVEPIPNDDEARKALQALQLALKPPITIPITLNPGDFLLFSNVHGLHARGQVKGERFLKRVYARHSLSRLQTALGASPSDRVFHSQKLILL